MSLALNEAQFAMFIQFLKQESANTLTIRKPVTKIGKQPDRDVWVLGNGIVINAMGEVVPIEDQPFIWFDWSVQQGLGTVLMKEVLPTIQIPLCINVLGKALELHTIMKHNFIPSLDGWGCYVPPLYLYSMM